MHGVTEKASSWGFCQCNTNLAPATKNFLNQDWRSTNDWVAHFQEVTFSGYPASLPAKQPSYPQQEQTSLQQSLGAKNSLI